VLRVVLDTNIFVSSIFWEKGNPHKVIELALDKKIQIFSSLAILEELEKILRRDFDEPDKMIHRQISLILEYARIIQVAVSLDVVKDDPEDDKIVECAASCNADYIVTGDKHLLNLKEYNRIKIISPRKLVEMLDR